MEIITQYRLLRSLRYGVLAALLGMVVSFISNREFSIFPMIAGGVLGVLLGMFELFVFERRLWQYGLFSASMIRLGIINFIAITVVSLVGYFVHQLDLPTPFGTQYFSLKEFLTSEDMFFVLLNINILSVVLIVYFQIEKYIGRYQIWNYIWGRYKTPIREDRIFLFVDLKSSTSLAESMGSEKYYDFLNQFFYDLTVPALETKAEIYQYVGDEVVFTWKEANGIRNNRCVDLFYRIQSVIDRRKQRYLADYGVIPRFKAGVHGGEAVSAEVGYLKKSIVYSGDVLNATSRIQSLCNSYDAPLLISANLAQKMSLTKSYQCTDLGPVELRGKEETLNLIKVQGPLAIT